MEGSVMSKDKKDKIKSISKLIKKPKEKELLNGSNYLSDRMKKIDEKFQAKMKKIDEITSTSKLIEESREIRKKLNGLLNDSDYSLEWINKIKEEELLNGSHYFTDKINKIDEEFQNNIKKIEDDFA